jgi:hypothetical protein
MNKRIVICALIVIFALAILNGCSSVPSRRITETGEIITVEKPLGVSTILRFEDVPIPAGFSIIREQSFIYQDASIRVGLLRYSGWAKPNQIIAFLKSQMPLYNWNLVNVVEFGDTHMSFMKNDENCTITIEALAAKSLINIVISPKAGTIATGFGAPSGRKSRF